MSTFTRLITAAATGILLMAGNAQAGFFKAKTTLPTPAATTTAATPEKTPLTAEEEKTLLASVSNSLREMSSAERHAKAREVRSAIRDWKATKALDGNADNKIPYIILAIFIPPLAVALYERGITSHFWI